MHELRTFYKPRSVTDLNFACINHFLLCISTWSIDRDRSLSFTIYLQRHYIFLSSRRLGNQGSMKFFFFKKKWWWQDPLKIVEKLKWADGTQKDIARMMYSEKRKALGLHMWLPHSTCCSTVCKCFFFFLHHRNGMNPHSCRAGFQFSYLPRSKK